MPSTEVFRFAAVRPAVKPPESAADTFFARYSRDGTLSPLTQKLKERGDDYDAAVLIANTYIESNEFPKGRIEPIVKSVREAANKSERGAAAAILSKLFGMDISEYIKSREYTALRTPYWDAYHALVFAGREQYEKINATVLMLKCFHYIELIAGNKENGAGNLSWEEVLEIRPLLSEVVALRPKMREAQRDARAELPEDINERFMALYESIVVRLRAADEIEQLDTLAGTRLVISLAAPQQQTLPEELDRREVVVADAEKESATAMGKFDGPPLWLKTNEGRDRLSDKTREIVKKHLDNVETIRQAVELLRSGAAGDLEGFMDRQQGVNAYRIRSLVHYHELARVVRVADLPIPIFIPDPTPSPDARGIKPSGIGDLYKINQQLMRYELGEVAHVENVMKSESRERLHVAVDEARETTAETVEKSTENERDLQTTERYELTREVQKSVEEHIKSDAGLAISASYGVVTVSAHADVAVENSSAEVAKEASNYAKQTTDRAITKLVTKISTEHIRSTLSVRLESC